MRWTGVIVGLFLIFHLLDLTWGTANPDFVRGDVYDNLIAQLRAGAGRDRLHRRQHRARRSTSSTARGACSRASGWNNPRFNPWRRYFAIGFAAVITIGNVSMPLARRHGGRELDERRRRSLDAKVPDGPDRGEVGQPQVRRQAREPGEQAAVQRSSSWARGLAGASAAATLGELGYQVEAAHVPRLAAARAQHRGAGRHQRGEELPATTATASTASSTTPIKGGDYRAREANVYRLAQVSVNIIDQCVAQGVPFAREYGGLLDNRSFGGAQVSPHVLRPRPDRPAAAARRVPGARAPGAPRQRRAARRAPRCSTSW